MKHDSIEHAILRAVHFAADRHRMQRRKDADASPYINHPIAVAEALAAAGVTDRTTLIAAILHDVIEDTETEPREIREAFGEAVCSVVEEVSDDKSLPKEVRKQLQVERTPHKSERARLVKLADLIANGSDVVANPPVSWDAERRDVYLAWARAVAAGCRGLNPELERRFEEEIGWGE